LETLSLDKKEHRNSIERFVDLVTIREERNSANIRRNDTHLIGIHLKDGMIIKESIIVEISDFVIND
jgi:hypothetical protein